VADRVSITMVADVRILLGRGWPAATRGAVRHWWTYVHRAGTSFPWRRILTGEKVRRRWGRQAHQHRRLSGVRHQRRWLPLLSPARAAPGKKGCAAWRSWSTTLMTLWRSP